MTAGLDTVAVRVPSHPVAQALLAAGPACRSPRRAPIASRTRARPRAAHVLADLDGRIDLVLDGGTDDGRDRVDDRRPAPCRRRSFGGAGGVSVEALRALAPELAVAERFADTGEAQPAPGQLLRHYAPAGAADRLRGRSRARRGGDRRRGSRSSPGAGCRRHPRARRGPAGAGPERWRRAPSPAASSRVA